MTAITELTLDYRDALPAILTGRPIDYRNRTPRPPAIARSHHAGYGPRRPELPPGERQPERVVPWHRYMAGIIHADDGNTYAWTGDSITLENVNYIYLLAEAMHT